MDRELEIINRLKNLGIELSTQDNRATDSPIFGVREISQDDELGDYDNIDT